MTWEAQLTGDHTDLQMLADAFTGEDIQVAYSGKEYVLRSSRFELLDSATSVRDLAVELVTAMSGCARLVLGAPKAIGVGASVYRVGPHGRSATFVLVGQAVECDRAMPITIVHGTKIYKPADPISKWLPLALKDPIVAKALRLRDADDLGWVDLHRLYEVIESNAGRLIHELGWASRNELSRFTGTANSVAAVGDKARHGVERSDPPRERMSLSNAHELIDRIMRAWLEWKASHRSEGNAT